MQAQIGSGDRQQIRGSVRSLAFVATEPPTALEPRAISEEKNKVFRSMLRINSAQVVRGQFSGYLNEDGVARDSDTETS